MKIIKMEQNSEDWLEFRKGKSGGSEFKDLWIPGNPLKGKVVEKLEANGKFEASDKKLTLPELCKKLTPLELAEIKLDSDPKERYYEIIAERVARPITPNDYVDRLNGATFSMMARGHILEDEALKAFEQATGKKVDKEDQVWQSDYDDNAYISPDGTITDKDGKVREAIEVKCLSSAKVVRAFLENTYPKEYAPQALKYFMVNEDLEVLHFVVYTDVIPGLELQIFDIKREDMQAQLEEATVYEQEILKRIDADARKIEDLSF